MSRRERDAKWGRDIPVVSSGLSLVSTAEREDRTGLGESFPKIISSLWAAKFEWANHAHWPKSDD